DLTVEKTEIEDPAIEIERLNEAIEKSTVEVERIREIAAQSLGEEEAQVFDAHAMFLSDPEMTDQVAEEINANKINAEAAYEEVTNTFITMLEGMEDLSSMQDRSSDVRNARNRIIAALLGVSSPIPAAINEEVIIVPHDLTPSDTAQLLKK